MSSGGKKGSGTFPIWEFFHPRNHKYAINQTFVRGSKHQGAEMRMKPLHSHVGELVTFPRRVPCQRKGRIQRLKQPESAEVTHASE